MKEIRTILDTEIEKTLPENKKSEKVSASHRAGRLLFLLFSLMLVFTLVSRALASITVARVSLSNPERNRLIYSLSGTGEIVPEEEKRLKVSPGYRIDEVYVRLGEVVDSGTVLYSYSLEDLQDKYTSIENEIEKMELLIAQEHLRQQPSEVKLSQSAILSRKQAKENIEVANTKLAGALKDYVDSKNNTKEKLLENKKKDYEASTKDYETLVYSQEKQLILAHRIVEDAKAALEETGETKSNIELLISNYKDAVLSKDKLKVYEVQEDILEGYYGGADAYEKHKEEIYTKASAAMGEGNFLWNQQNIIIYYEERLYKYQEELQKLLSSTDPLINSEANRRVMTEKYKGAMDSYFSYLEQYEGQIDLMEDAYQADSGELKRLRRNDKLLKNHLKQYYIAIEDNLDIEGQKEKLFNFLYGEKQKEIEPEVEKMTLALTRAEEDYALLEKEFDRIRNDLQAKNSELKKEIQSLEDGTYDYEEALDGKRQEVEAAKEAVRLASQIVEMSNLEEDLPSDSNSKKISELVLQGHRIDLKEKEQELKELRELMEGSGEVKSPDKGVVTFVGVEAGRTTTGEEMIRLGFGDYVFRAALEKEAVANIVEGDTVTINRAGKKTGIEAETEKFMLLEDGRSEITARLPEDEYLLGEKAGFKITTQSEQFELCIPIQALREDNYGYYVLITREQEDILGTQLIADRIDVTILDKGNQTVAVDGAISSKSQVITDSNKYIKAGDRVRVNY